MEGREGLASHPLPGFCGPVLPGHPLLPLLPRRPLPVPAPGLWGRGEPLQVPPTVPDAGSDRRGTAMLWGVGREGGREGGVVMVVVYDLP